MKANTMTFPRRLPDSRLGEKHDTLNSFQTAQHSEQLARSMKHYSLVVVSLRQQQKTKILLESCRRFSNPFEEETVESSACRELEKDTNLKVTLDEMTKSKVGVHRHTSENDPVELIIHLFRIKLERCSAFEANSYEALEWHDDVNMIPLDDMPADNSLWLTALLSFSTPIEMNGWYHFEGNFQETNKILHHYLDIRPKILDLSLEQRLFHTLHENHNNLLSIKEFKENYAFCNAVRTAFKGDEYDIVMDVAGGHGALGALFLICTKSSRAIVIDPADVGGGRIQEAWGSEFIHKGKELTYRRECLRTGLPDELEQALKSTIRNRILVVACHACQHLSEEILQISCRYGVHVASMPCCQKDRSPGSPWKAVSKNLSVPFAKTMDILQCGKMMALGSHSVRLKCINSKITPQNRIIGKSFLSYSNRKSPINGF